MKHVNVFTYPRSFFVKFKKTLVKLNKTLINYIHMKKNSENEYIKN